MWLLWIKFLMLVVFGNGQSNNSHFIGSLHFSNSSNNLLEAFKKNWHVEEWFHLGIFTEDYLEDINEHWMEFGPPNDSSFYVLAVLYVFIMTIGLGGNALVIGLYFRRKSLRTSANALIVNLAISDCLMMSKMPMFIINCWYKGPVLGDFACRLYGFLGGLSGTVSICTLASISLDRFFVIKYPLSRKFTGLRVKISLITAWVYGFTFSIIPVLNIGLGKYTPEGYLTSCSFDYLTNKNPTRFFIMAFFVAAWVIPFLLIAFSYVNIVQVVLKRSAQKPERDSFRHVKDEDKRKQELKLAIIVLGVIFLWAIAWTPYSIVALLGIFHKKHLISPMSSMIPALFCKTASAIDPYVYALSHPKFKAELKATLKRSIPKDNNRVWSSETERVEKKFERTRSEADEDINEVELNDISTVSSNNIGITGGPTMDFRHHEAKLKREASLSKLIGLKPNFSNKDTAIRKMSRKWSTRDRKNSMD